MREFLLNVSYKVFMGLYQSETSPPFKTLIGPCGISEFTFLKKQIFTKLGFSTSPQPKK